MRWSRALQVIMGMMNEYASKRAARQVLRIINRAGLYAKGKRIRYFGTSMQTVNTLYTCNVGFPLDLTQFAMTFGAKTSYESEIFTGLFYAPKMPHYRSQRIKVSMFVGGNINIMGTTCIDDLRRTFLDVYPLVKTFAKFDKSRPLRNTEIESSIQYLQIQLDVERERLERVERLERLEKMLERQRELEAASRRGQTGQTPMHFALPAPTAARSAFHYQPPLTEMCTTFHDNGNFDDER